METIYKTADGSEFETMDEAMKHEAVLANVGKIEHWLNTRGTSDRMVKTYTTLLSEWESAREEALGIDLNVPGSGAEALEE